MNVRRPWGYIAFQFALGAFGLVVARPINAARRFGSRLLGWLLRLAGIRRDPAEGDDGSPR